MPLKKLRKKIKKWLPLVIAIIQLATAVITAINKEPAGGRKGPPIFLTIITMASI